MTNLPEIHPSLKNMDPCPSIFCHCRGCTADKVRRVDAECARIRARFAALATEEDIAADTRVAHRLRVALGRHEAHSALCEVDPEATRRVG